MCIRDRIIAGIRAVRASKNIPNKDTLELRAIGTAKVTNPELVRKLANLSDIALGAEKDPAAASFMVGTAEYNVPLASNIDVAAEIERLEKEIAYLEGFRKSVEKKLGNERFVANAPAAVVDTERRKLADATSKIDNLRASLEALK